MSYDGNFKFDLDSLDDKTSLDSVYEIEDVLLLLSEMTDRKKFYEAVKKRKSTAIDQSIFVLNTRMNKLRNLILNTMKEHNEKQKSLTFPGVGRVTRKLLPDEISIIDEDVFTNHVKNINRYKDIAEEVVSDKKSKELIKELIDQQKQSNQTQIGVPGVSIVGGRDNISITYDKDDGTSPPTPASEAIQRKREVISDQTLSNLDGLNL